MKKKIMSIALTVLVALSLAVPAAAAGPRPDAGPCTARLDAVTDDPLVNELMTTVITNRSAILSIRSDNAALGARLYALLGDLKENGVTLPAETQAQLQALQEQLKANRDELSGTGRRPEGMPARLREAQCDQDAELTADTLQAHIAAQEARMTQLNAIGGLIQQAIDLLSTI